MDTSSERRVEITGSGRSGSVVYREALGSLSFSWEFGGGDVLAIVQVEDAKAWKTQPSWMAGRRAAILRSVADEVIRQKAPNCRAEIDEAAGVIVLREGARTAQPPPMPPKREFSMTNFRSLRTALALVVLVVAVIAGCILWFKNKVLVIDPGKGTPIGLAVRTDTHIAILIESLVPYMPSLHRDASKDRYRISVFLVPLDGSEPHLVPVTGELEGNSFSLAKILGSDGRTLWFNVVGVGGVDQKNLEVVDGDDFRSANPSLDPMWWEDGRGMEMNGRLRTTSPDHQSAVEFEPGTLKAIPVEVVATPGKWPFPPKPEDFLCAGFFTSPNTWLGLHSTAEVEGEFAPKKFVRRVVRQEDAKQMRRFHRGALDAPVDDRYSRILSMESLGNEEYLNAAFLRMDAGSEPLRLGDPDGALLIYTSAPGLNGTAIIARVDTEGRIIWKVDTGIDRFSLSQILPGTNSMAFVGTRPPVPDKVSEPLLVIVENGTGRMVAHSLWQ